MLLHTLRILLFDSVLQIMNRVHNIYVHIGSLRSSECRASGNPTPLRAVTRLLHEHIFIHFLFTPGTATF